MAHIELVSRTATTLTCRVADLPSWAAGVNWYIGLDTGDMPYNMSCSAADTTWTFSRVEHMERPGTGFAMEDSTLYYVKYVAYDSGGNRPDPAQTDAFATLWVWSSWSTLGVPAAEFNRLIDLVFAVAAAKGITLPGTAASYYVTAGTSMRASQLNAVRSLIATLGASVPAAADEDLRITADFFTGLVDSLYSIT